MNLIRKAFLKVNELGYRAIRPLLFLENAQDAHIRLLHLLERADESSLSLNLADWSQWLAFDKTPVQVGGVELKQPFILAAGFVKGLGFESEAEALDAVEAGQNIMPGWKVMPRLVGLVEFGSFTRHPRLGNLGQTLWRDVPNQSIQNRIGLKNPGAIPAARFLQKHITALPAQFGINIAVSPNVSDTAQQVQEVRESFRAFLERGVVPNWFTLNISCPNTEDDPSGNQTESLTRALCLGALEEIQVNGYQTPLWVKVSPDLAESQYGLLMRVFEETGVKAAVATNTIAQQAPTNPAVQAGLGGANLHRHSLYAVDSLLAARQNDKVDIVGCGGVLDANGYLDYKARGIVAVQYWSALVYRGPLAAALIQAEIFAMRDE